MKKTIKSIPFRRKLRGRTNYNRRINLLKSDKLRLVVRKSLKHIMVSLVEYDEKGDKVIISVNSGSLQKLGWKADKGNIPAAYLTGFLLGLNPTADYPVGSNCFEPKRRSREAFPQCLACVYTVSMLILFAGPLLGRGARNLEELTRRTRI